MKAEKVFRIEHLDKVVVLKVVLQ